MVQEDIERADGRREPQANASQWYVRHSVFGVSVTDITMEQAISVCERMIREQPSGVHSVFFVNAHSLNIVREDDEYRRILDNADYVFGDGTGVRWAVRLLHGARLLDNINGTDLVPRLFHDLAGQGYRYFLLGNTPESIELAAAEARRRFPGWTQAGFHHGYLEAGDHRRVIEQINASGAHLLLVGMGNPLQEKWISRHLVELDVPLCMGIGGLPDYWAGKIERAPAWLRRLGCEWMYLLLQQPHKLRRYVLGNALFLLRLAHSKWLEHGGRGS